MNKKLLPFVKAYPQFMAYLPYFKNYAGNSLYPFIFLRYDIYQDLLTDHPKPWYIATLHHELLHHKRQKKQGWVLFGIKYLTNPGFRINEELLAYKESMRWYKKYNVDFPVDRIARFLSGPLYLWAVSYNEAKNALVQMWQKVE